MVLLGKARERAANYALELSFLTSMTSLEQNYPNPFNSSTTIRYDLSARSHVVLGIHDILGREVAMLVDEQKQGGAFVVSWNAGRVASQRVVYEPTGRPTVLLDESSRRRTVGS
ncbi:MAG: hypothetical protein V3U69_06245 [Bacteroidota bacterium]